MPLIGSLDILLLYTIISLGISERSYLVYDSSCSIGKKKVQEKREREKKKTHPSKLSNSKHLTNGFIKDLSCTSVSF